MPPLSSAIARQLDALFGAEGWSADSAERIAYSYDNSRREALPDAVVFVESAAALPELVALARRERLALTARGRGTNTTGATVPFAGGLVVSFERMNRILAIDPDNRMAIVEPGVLNADLQRAAAAHGFFWPPDPTSAEFCTVGGNLACNAGGPRAVKYGASRDNTLALAAVTGAGAAIRTGSPTTKGATGYDLTRFLVGSEGTLAFITEATLKLTPRPAAVRSLRAVYDDVAAAARAVARIMAQPETPSALEFMDGEALRLAREYGGDGIPDGGALLLIEVDGPADALGPAASAVAAAARVDGCRAVDIATDAADAARLWAARKALSPRLRQLAPKKINEDVVVPVSRVPALIERLTAIARASGIPIVNFGHAGNGNLHVNLLYRPEDPAQAEAAPLALSEVFDAVIALGGTLSGEHGIGAVKREFLSRAIDVPTLALMKEIKRAFDPDGVMNPGKLLP